MEIKKVFKISSSSSVNGKDAESSVPINISSILSQMSKINADQVTLFSDFNVTGGLYYKCFTLIIYDCNDTVQYYKTTITIVIDDPS